MPKSIPYDFFKSLLAVGAFYCIFCAALNYFQPIPYFNERLVFTASSLFWFGLVGFICSLSYSNKKLKPFSISGMSVSLLLLILFILSTWRLVEFSSMLRIKTILFIFSVCMVQCFILSQADLKRSKTDSFKKIGYAIVYLSAVMSIVMVLFRYKIGYGSVRNTLYIIWPIVGALNLLCSILIIEFYEINSNLKRWFWRFLQLCLIGGVNTYVFCEFFSHKVNVICSIAKSCLPIVCIIYTAFLLINLFRIDYERSSKRNCLIKRTMLFAFSALFVALNFMPNKIVSDGISVHIGREEMLLLVGQVAYGYPFDFFRVFNDNWVRSQNLAFDLPAFFTNISLALLLLFLLSMILMIIVNLLKIAWNKRI